ncbi:MAG TPA: response regulator transcription factor [Actinomycetota bacterium]|nr:response regulator transcription factor [Actinomycetota bacterium]
MSSLRVVVAGYGPIYRAGLCAVLPTNEDGTTVAVVGAAGDLRKARSLATLLRPDVIVTDLLFPGEDPHPIPRLLEGSPESRVLVLSERSDPEAIQAALDDGVSGYVLRNAHKDDLIVALHEVAAGRRYLDPRIGRLPQRHLQLTPKQLTEREREVLKFLALGYTNSEIASCLVISVRTVETHRSNLQRKLGVRTRAELARAAWREGVGPLLPTDRQTTPA